MFTVDTIAATAAHVGATVTIGAFTGPITDVRFSHEGRNSFAHVTIAGIPTIRVIVDFDR